jgi:hypothetical protein
MEDSGEAQNPRKEPQVSLEEINVILGYIVALDSEARRTLFERIRGAWCQGCGVAEPKEGRRCQCQNDE